jgi:hypothetical protein
MGMSDKPEKGSGSIERVAYDLAITIANHERTSHTQDRAYWLDLYHASYKAACGSKP